MNILTFEEPARQLTLSITPLGYEFPHITKGHDANWLVVQTDLTFGEQRFGDVSPSLEARDLARIAKWFDQLTMRSLPDWTRLGFLEPNLEFEVFRATDTFVRIGVHLSHESKPPFRIEANRGMSICHFELSYEQLAEMAAAWRVMAKEFPSRDEPGRQANISNSAQSKNFCFTAHALGQIQSRFGTKETKRLC